MTRVTYLLGAAGGLLALSSIFFPWYRFAGFSFQLLAALKSNPCPRGAHCEIVPVSPTLIVAFACTIVGGCLGIASTMLHRTRTRLSRIMLVVGFVSIIIGTVVSFSDAVVREGLSIGFYTDSFSAVLFLIHIVTESVRP